MEEEGEQQRRVEEPPAYPPVGNNVETEEMAVDSTSIRVSGADWKRLSKRRRGRRREFYPLPAMASLNFKT